MIKRGVCILIGHKWNRVRYPDSPDGTFLRCRRCGHINESEAGPTGPMVAGI
jgi:hypothetical protein